MKILNFLFEKKQKKEVLNTLDPKNVNLNDGDAILLTGEGGVYNQGLSFERGATESARIRTYRQISQTAEIDEVITDIVNETFIFQRDKRAFSLDWFPDVSISDQLKEKVYNEYLNIYNILEFDDCGSELLRTFYVDGRIVFQKIKDENNPRKGLKYIVPLDCLNTVKVKIIPRRDIQTKMININDIQEFFVYTSKSYNTTNYLNNIVYNFDDVVEGARLETQDITYVTSGLVDSALGITIGHLDKAIVPYNNLKMMEQSMVIFRVVRAPTRRAFYVDVSDLGKAKAEEYMKNMQNRFKSKLVYNVETGTWLNKQSVVAMTEDYYIPRFNENKTTEIQNIDGQSSQEILDEVNYMKDKLYQSLNAPKSRYTDEGSVFVYGKSDQISRDEYRYKKFVDRVRNRFMLSFDDMLKTQLILKGIINESDWDEIQKSYFWNFTEDNAFIEYKDAQIFENRVDTALKLKELVEMGYYSDIYIRKNILKQTDEDIVEINKQNMKKDSQEELPDGNPPDNDSQDDENDQDDESQDDKNDSQDDQDQDDDQDDQEDAK